MKHEHINAIKNGLMSLIVEVDGKTIHTSKGFGVWPLWHLFKSGLSDGPFSIYDKVIGMGAARIMEQMGNILFLYAATITEAALERLCAKGVNVQYDHVVPAILNKNRDGLCPVEKISLDSSTFEDLMNRLDEFYERVRTSYEERVSP